jgi:hypothetical protein
MDKTWVSGDSVAGAAAAGHASPIQYALLYFLFVIVCVIFKKRGIPRRECLSID